MKDKKIDTESLAKDGLADTKKLGINPITPAQEDGLRQCHQRKMALSPKSVESMTLFGKPSDKKSGRKSMPTLVEASEADEAEEAPIEESSRANTR